MTPEAVLDLFRRSGALLEGHFKLTSGLHSDRYLQCALVLQYPDLAEQLGAALAARTRHLQPTAVLSPALGGIVIGQEVGRALQVRALFAERQEGALTLRRGFRLAETDRVLVVDAPEELQIDRVRRRSGLAHDEVRAIVAAQASRARRLAAADDVIENRGTIDELREQVAALHRKYLEYSKAAQ